MMLQQHITHQKHSPSPTSTETDMVTPQTLWIGMPVVSLVVEMFNIRTAGSTLHQDLRELVVDFLETYEACARDLAGDVT